MMPDPGEILFEEFDAEQLVLMKQVRDLLNSLQRPNGCDRQAVETAVSDLYLSNKIDRPRIIWCDSVWDLVAFRGLLFLLAVGEYDRIRFILDNELTDRRWRSAWSKLIDQFGNAEEFADSIDQAGLDELKSGESRSGILSRGNSTYMDCLFGQSLEVDINPYRALDNLEKLLPSVLGVKAKIQLRRTLYSQFAGETQGVIRDRWGLRSISSLVPGDYCTEFECQFEEPSKDYIIDLCSRYLKQDEFSLNLAAAFSALGGADGAIEERPSTRLLFRDLLAESTSLIGRETVIQSWFPAAAFVVAHLDLDIDEHTKREIRFRYVFQSNHVEVRPYERLCLVCEPPSKVYLDDRGFLHSDHGPAVVYKDGFSVYALNGVTVPSHVLTNPDSITVDTIDKEENVEIRRIMIEQYGIEKYLRDSNARVIDSDDCGVLYKKEQAFDEPIVVVRVTNSSHEPDGSKPKQFFLRVPPYITTAREAVAWTFDLGKEEYHPAVQS